MQLERWLYMVPLRSRSLFRGRQVDHELDEELRYHLDRKTGGEMTGAKCLDGSDAGVRVGLKNLVMTKVRGTWLIAVFHNMDLPTPTDRRGQRTVPCQFR